MTTAITAALPATRTTPRLTAVAGKTVVVHTVTYFLAGWVAFAVLDYERLFSLPEIAVLMRPTSDPWVMAGPLMQPLRGLLFALPLWLLGERLFARRDGWLVLWLLFVCIGILAPFGAAPGSIEGVVFTKLPLWFHVKGLPEMAAQSLATALVLWVWLRHPRQRWLSITLVTLFVLALALPALGLLTSHLRP